MTTQPVPFSLFSRRNSFNIITHLIYIFPSAPHSGLVLHSFALLRRLLFLCKETEMIFLSSTFSTVLCSAKKWMSCKQSSIRGEDTLRFLCRIEYRAGTGNSVIKYVLSLLFFFFNSDPSPSSPAFASESECLFKCEKRVRERGPRRDWELSPEKELRGYSATI